LKIRKPFLLLVIILFILSSCQIETVQNSNQTFFDIETFLEKELNELSNLKSIKKKVTINDRIDEKTLNNFNLKTDLEIFINSNINKIAWLDKYKVDSLFDNTGKLSELKYTAVDNKLKTREFRINYTLGKVNSISVFNGSNNSVSSIEQHLKYFPSKGYSVESLQEITLGSQQSLKVEVTYN